jgi:hypothetical protein
MPIRDVVTPEEWERLTGERGSVYIDFRPRPPAKKRWAYLCPICLRKLDQRRSGLRVRCRYCKKSWPARDD